MKWIIRIPVGIFSGIIFAGLRDMTGVGAQGAYWLGFACAMLMDVLWEATRNIK